jgi:putative ABC transport system substrate-binding protein
MDTEPTFEGQNEEETKAKEDQERKRKRQQKSVVYAAVAGVVIVLVVGGLLLRARSAEQNRTFTIGVINYATPLEKSFEGFKAGLAELGYIEDENVTYIYNGLMPDPETGEREAESFVAQDVDLIFTMGTQATSQAKQAVEGTDIAVIFAPVINPVEEGIVESVRQPGGNVTGIQSGSTLSKALEWLLKLVPAATKVYVPYHAEDAVSVTSIAALREAAASLGVELVLDDVTTPEEVLAAVEALPEDAVIFWVAAPSMGGDELFDVAAERGIAVGSNLSSRIESGALVVYATDYFSMGKQAARLADQALRGVAPADLPVETSEYFLTINLKAAEAIDLDISDEVLRQADTVVR